MFFFNEYVSTGGGGFLKENDFLNKTILLPGNTCNHPDRDDDKSGEINVSPTKCHAVWIWAYWKW